MTSRRESKSSEESKSSDSNRKSQKSADKFDKYNSSSSATTKSRSGSDKRKNSSASTNTKQKDKTDNNKPNMEELSYYEILDVSPNADEAEIKKAYRKNAIRWHPDKNLNNKEEAEAMFKLVAEAYEVLSNPEKREVYDRYGKEGLKPGGAAQPSDFFYHFDLNRAQNLFEQMFGDDPFFNRGFGGFGGFGGGFNDPFFGGMQSRSRNSGSRRRDPFEDFFGGGFSDFGDMGGFSQSFSSSSFGSGGGTSKTTRSFTTIVNGQRVTKTETTVRYPDGRVETTTNETTGDETQRIGDGRRNSGRRLNWF